MDVRILCSIASRSQRTVRALCYAPVQSNLSLAGLQMILRLSRHTLLDDILVAPKADNSAVPHSIYMSHHCIFPTHSSRKSQARHSSEASKWAGSRGERLLSPSTSALRFPPISPTQRIFDKA
ncbi:hypothetical protein AVEN_69157-1 [Araneus ventricosus]|uniref:Uncharacterized protein n=1 Tax=Araneus ventricosus TaxID=182803 RepID=A0A4Y2R4E6_ARAVE|nr:hypothetical protein AVEN_15118-1 [Araneus ventricosus]GBN70551.1 hypothetical protein AVEN_44690-1 [Araneus ventricosus]GBN70557.1 hypothetical protein AVEN_187653-1 [Araneus ventricosus]GBN72176.1 hypothetical protein AVEN_69157-1 [Araneus ventricosus]